jgi:hypothetical protein
MLPSWVSSWHYLQMLYWKVIASFKHSSLFGDSISDKEKRFIKMTPDVGRVPVRIAVEPAVVDARNLLPETCGQCYKTFLFRYFRCKLE